MNWEYSCGGVVFTRQYGELRFVLARGVNGYYGFPKGHMEPGETEEQTALREIFEEVHLRPRLIPGFRRECTYALPKKKDTWKRVTLFLAEFENQEIIHQQKELLEAPLVTYEEALALLSNEQYRTLLREAFDFLNQ